MRTAEALGEAVDALHELDLAGLSDAELEELGLDVDQQLARLTGEHARIIAAIAAAEPGRRTARGRRGVARSAAQRLPGDGGGGVAPGRVARGDARGARAGEITSETRGAVVCRRFKPDVFADAESTLLGYATSLRWHQFGCSGWRAGRPRWRRASGRQAPRPGTADQRYDGCLDFRPVCSTPSTRRRFSPSSEHRARPLRDGGTSRSSARRAARDRERPAANARERRADALVQRAYRVDRAEDGSGPAPVVVCVDDPTTPAGLSAAQRRASTAATRRRLLSRGRHRDAGGGPSTPEPRARRR